MENKFKFSTIFSSIKLRPVVSEEKDKYLALASANELRKFLPDIDLKANIDLLPIAFDACVVNRVNKNGDVINGLTASEVAKNFINKPINLEHDRTKIVGCIVSYNFSKFGSNESLAELDVKEMTEPFNITLGGVIWKVVNPKLSDLIEESNDPSSSEYMTISASWELGFNDYNLVVLKGKDKNIENGKFITDEAEKEKLSNNLKALGGTGKINGDSYIYRQVLGEVIPLGIGLTTNPAADVGGVVMKTEEDIPEIEIEEDEVQEVESNQAENNISQISNLDVKQERITNRIIMKINNISEITDELLKEVKASSVTDFIAEELQKVSEKFIAEKAEKDNAIQAANQKFETVSSEHEALKKQLEEVNQKLATIEAEAAAKAKEEAFNIRMAGLDEEFDLDDEDRQVLATDIKDLEEETFAAYKKKMAVLMKEKNKAAKKAKMAKAEQSVATEVIASEQPVTVSETVSEVVEDAISNGKVEKASIPNSSSTSEATLKEKYGRAFSLEEGFIVK